MYGKYEIEKKISVMVADSLKRLDAVNISGTDCEEIDIEVPKDRKNGDLSTNTALRYAKMTGRKPRELAEAIVSGLSDVDGIVEKTDIAGPGFINFYLSPSFLYTELKDILAAKENYGRLPANGKSIDVEYVSANPTGPLHIGNARGGAIGDVIANVYKAVGWRVTKEFYLNDAGNQIAKFGESLDARFMQLFDANYPFPEEGYHGKDIIDNAAEFRREHGDALKNASREERIAKLTEYALNCNIANMQTVLAKYGINYDVWFKESVMHADGSITRAIDLLTSRGATYEKDGALWFKATDYDCEKDEVLIRANGYPTYYAADIAYHLNKLSERKFDLAVNVWGADHHGHVHRLKMALKAAGIEPERLQIVLMQLVHLVKNDETVRMSKRRGDAVTLDELLDDVSCDAVRFIFNQSNPNAHLDFDMDLAIKESVENPVFYVQYAHARICSILRNVKADEADLDLTLLKEHTELALLDKMSDFTKEMTTAACEYDPSKVTRYATDLASLFHGFYNACRVNCDEGDIKNARLALVAGCGIVLKNTLHILGVNAPESM